MNYRQENQSHHHHMEKLKGNDNKVKGDVGNNYLEEEDNGMVEVLEDILELMEELEIVVACFLSLCFSFLSMYDLLLILDVPLTLL